MEKHSRYIVLNYHSLSEDGRDEFGVHPSVFREQLHCMRALNVPFVRIGDKGSHTGTGIVLSFDDGNESDFLYAFPELQPAGIHALFFPIANEIGTRGKMSRAQIRRLSEEGFEIGSHGLDHCDLTTLTEKQQLTSLQDSKKILEDITGSAVNLFAFPFGMYTEPLVELALSAGYSHVMTTRVELNDNAAYSPVIHRWNVKRSTSIQELTAVISGRGTLGWNVTARSAAKHFTRKIIGAENVHRLRTILNPGEND
jgi:peptidoglycan/xylan/chitin deacetylase (PgdA/CDA1 family)